MKLAYEKENERKEKEAFLSLGVWSPEMSNVANEIGKIYWPTKAALPPERALVGSALAGALPFASYSTVALS